MSYVKRIVSIELRRSGVLPVALVAAVPCAALLCTSPGSYDGRWLQLAAEARTGLLLALPLTLGGGAWLGLRESRHHLGELLDSSPKPRALRVLPQALILAVLAVLSYLVIIGAGLPWVLGRAGYFPPAVVPLTLIGALALVAAAWLGLAAGRAIPRLTTVPVLVLASALLAGIVPMFVQDTALIGNAPDRRFPFWWLTPILVAQIDDFETVTARISVLQAVLLTGLASSALLVAMFGRRRVLLSWLPALAGLALAFSLLPATQSDALVNSPQARALACTTDAPEVCVGKVHAYQMDEVAAAAQPVLKGLSRIPGAPTRAVEMQRPDEDGPKVWAARPTDTIPFPDPFAIYGGSQDFDVRMFQQSLVDEAFWPRCDASGRSSAQALQQDLGQAVIGGWLAGANPVFDSAAPSTQETAHAESAYRALVALPEPRQKVVVQQAWKATRSCQPDAMAAIDALG